MTRDQRIKRGDKREIEFRAMPAAGDGLSTRADADSPGFTGYASTFGVVDSYFTVIDPTAFDKTLTERAKNNGERIPHLWQHWSDVPIGKHREMRTDDKGLFVDVELIDDGAEGTVAIKRLRGGVPLGMSFGFRTIRERPATDADTLIFSDGLDALPNWIRDNLPGSVWVIEELKLYETSTVTFPANDAATIDAMRSERDAVAITSLLDDLRSGRRLDDTAAALITDLVAAVADRPDLRQQAPPTDSTAPRTVLTPDDRRDAIRLWAMTTGIDPALLGLHEVA